MWAGPTARWSAASTGNRLVILKMEAVYSYETEEHVITTQCKSPKGGHFFVRKLRHYCGCEVLTEAL
jgi:hypothetical protein